MANDIRIELTRTGRVTSRNYQAAGFHRVAHGAHAKNTEPASDKWVQRRAEWLDRVRAVVALCANANPVLYGPTALQALKVALPREAEDWERVHLLLRSQTDRPARRHVVAHTTSRDLVVWRRPDGLPVLNPVDHWVQLGTISGDAMVEVGDGFVRRKEPLLTLPAIQTRLDELGGVTGVRRARQALNPPPPPWPTVVTVPPYPRPPYPVPPDPAGKIPHPEPLSLS
jgi:hypothetical protein